MKNLNLTWNVYRYDINKHEIYSFNVFDHGRFKDEILALLNTNISYDEFSEKVKHIAMYYYWCKSEHEIVITSFPPYISRKEADRIANENFNIRTHVNLERGSKVDIYDQLKMNWDKFIDYIWFAKKNYWVED